MSFIEHVLFKEDTLTGELLKQVMKNAHVDALTIGCKSASDTLQKLALKNARVPRNLVRARSPGEALSPASSGEAPSPASSGAPSRTSESTSQLNERSPQRLRVD
jgi:hypothetical protein